MAPPSSYPAFSVYPVTGPVTGPVREIEYDRATAIKVSLVGAAFSAQVQISNAAPGFGQYPHLFTPAEGDWTTVATLIETDPPLDVAGQVRWSRVKLISGTLTGGTIAESHTQGDPGKNAADVRQVAAGLVATTDNKIARRVFTPEMYGAKGDGIADDQMALHLACAALQAAGSGQLLLSQSYRVGRGNLGNHRVGAIELLGGDKYEIIFASGAELLMDNLNPSTGNGDELGGIYFAGPINDITIRHPRIRWLTRPNARSQGDGIMGRGYPSDSGPTIKKCTIEYPYIENCPQAHIILMGVSDPHVIAPGFKGGRADGMHFNACRRPVVTGKIRAESIGDDAAALVTYYGPTGTPIYPGNTDRTPFFINGLTEWSNSGALIDAVDVVDGEANGCRLNGALDATVGVVNTRGTTPFGLQLDAAITNGNDIGWTVAASRGCSVGRVITDGASRAVLAVAHNIDRVVATADTYLKWDVEIGQVVARNSADLISVLISDLSGIKIDTLDVDGEVRVNLLASNIVLGDVKTASVLTVDTSGTVEVKRLLAKSVALNNTNIKGEHWVLTDAMETAFTTAGDVSGKINRVEIIQPNRSAAAGQRALLLARGVNLALPDVQVTHDAGPLASWLEIGGGADAANRSRNIKLNMDVKHTGDNTTDRLTLQGGPFAPINLDYRLRRSVDGGVTWASTVRQDSQNTAVALLNAYRSDNYTMPGGGLADIPMQAVTQLSGMNWDNAAGTATILQPGVYALTPSYLYVAQAGDNYNFVASINGAEASKFGYGTATAGTLTVTGTRYFSLKPGDTLKVRVDVPAGRVIAAGSNISLALIG